MTSDCGIEVRRSKHTPDGGKESSSVRLSLKAVALILAVLLLLAGADVDAFGIFVRIVDGLLR